MLSGVFIILPLCLIFYFQLENHNDIILHGASSCIFL
jgi:hypothetical protein